MKQYITEQGDTWDLISYKVYGKEQYMDKIMEVNMQLLNIFSFSAGTELTIPELEMEEEEGADWR